MRISVSEFSQMLEKHSQEMRQMQDDFNLMADEKDEEIKRLNDKIDRFYDVLKDFKEHCVTIVKEIGNGGPIKGAAELIQESYENKVDGLDGY